MQEKSVCNINILTNVQKMCTDKIKQNKQIQNTNNKGEFVVKMSLIQLLKMTLLTP